MKKLLLKNKIFVLVLAFMVALLSALFALNTTSVESGVNSFTTGGVYTAFAEEGQSESDETLKELKAKVSTDGKYLLLISAFDDSFLKEDGLYYIGYKYTQKGTDIDTTQIAGAKTSTYYGAVNLKTANGVKSYGAKDIYSNDAYENYGLIVCEIEFETTYQEEGVYLEDLHAFITEMQANENGGYDVVDSIEGKNYFNKDKYRLQNGGFENGMEGWTKVGNIGDVDTATHYWVNDPESAEGFAFGMDGEKMFSAYAPDAMESAVGTLTSSTFTVGGSGFVTFKVGAMKDGNYVYVDVVDATSKQILARYYNGLWADRTEDVKSGCTLIGYKADLSAFMGKEVFFRISDNADSGYGLFFVDSFITYYEEEPSYFNNATPVSYAVSGTIYDVFNGGFEMGDVQGWWNNGEPGAVTNANAFFSGVEYGKVGEYLYSGVEDYQAGNGREGNQGVLTSSAFEIGGCGWISFKLGGGNSRCYVQVIDATTNQVLARYRQQNRQDAVLIQYVADLSSYVGRLARIQVVDYASSDWGCVSFDNVITYYAQTENLPEGLTANDVKYELVNGSFENGLDGWKMTITEAGAHNTLGWVESSEHDAGWYTKNDDNKDGSNLFTFVRPDGTNCENTKGTLETANFVLKQNTYVAFRFGGAGGAQNHDVHIQLCSADGSVIKTFYNDKEGKVNTRMNAYYYYYDGVETDCFFRVVDNSISDYGCFVVDDFRANLTSAPEGFTPAIL